MILLAFFVPGLVLVILLYLFGVVGLPMAILLFIASYFASLLLWAAPLLVALPFSPPEGKVKRSLFYAFYASCMLDVVLRVLRIRVKTEGLEQLPDEPFLLVGNHRSALDPVISMYLLRRKPVGFVAKQELFNIPIIGKMMTNRFCLSLNRGTLKDELKTIRRATGMITDGVSSIGIYPEGTRNAKEELLPFKNGAFKIAQRADCPIAVVVIRNSENVMKNLPFRRTKVELKLCGVLSREELAGLSTAQIGEKVRTMMEEELCPSVADVSAALTEAQITQSGEESL